MVMDAAQPQQPSPQSVGREFVRQYYTLLNKAPNHLHRFYNNNSSFLHGDATLVIGQKNIHNRIQQLNFHDCHAKISQVDAQATLGNGVVVQVTGELSNDGQQMRRFTQTFVLASQSPKKYYVHNDIFRYQDLYADEDNEGEARSENDEDADVTSSGSAVSICKDPNSQPAGGVAVPPSEVPQPLAPTAQVAPASGAPVVAQPGASATQPIYYSMPPAAAGGRPVQVMAPAATGAAPQAGAVPMGGAPFPAAGAASANQQPAPGVPQMNGVVAHDELLTSLQQPAQPGGVATVQQTMVGAQAPSPIIQAVGSAALAASVLAGQQAGILPPAQAAAYPASQMVPAQIIQPQQPPAAALATTPPTQQAPQPAGFQQPQQPQPAAPEADDSKVNATAPDSSAATASNNNAAPATVTPVAPAPTPAPVDDFKTINEQQQQEKYEAAKQQQQLLNEPKTYANLFKSSNASSGVSQPSSFVNAALQQQQQLQQAAASNNNSGGYQSGGGGASAISTASYSQSAQSSNAYQSRNNEGAMRSMDNNNMGGGPMNQRPNTRLNKDFEPRRPSNAQFGDNQQLFLGNIPHHATEEDLKQMFSRFGNVLELRILSKPSGKLPPGIRNPLNYGFITYDDADAVQNCLSNCPLYFPPDSPDGQKLNVEEKKPRMRSDMPPRQMGGGNNMNSMSQSQRNNMGGPASRSITSGGGGMMRGNNNANGPNMTRGGNGGGGGPRLAGGFQRSDNRTNNGGGQGGRGGPNNAQAGGGNYGSRR